MQGCCGSTVFDLETEGCCGSVVFDLETDFCCETETCEGVPTVTALPEPVMPSMGGKKSTVTLAPTSAPTSGDLMLPQCPAAEMDGMSMGKKGGR